ncbi:3-dehydroquinate synthase family protein [Treponema sp.]|uniref:3-dehydroquinate synthase n=1 Tax=Treponema sp. TaxID=166 RepID=UPI0025E5C796|nr:3-dehydroquinate synthase family protein [Treponema sp.]MCR5219115.1 3-dehydroquinate synthase [Treponema sp.]
MSVKETDTFVLKYPETSGFDKSTIHFYSGEADLTSIYFNQEENSIKRLFVTDTNIAGLSCMKSFLCHFMKAEDISSIKIDSTYSAGNDCLLILGPGESFKTIQNVLKIVSTALDADFNRNSLFISIGGGVLCDMTGFAASMFKRGIEVEFVPTTLLADVDAAIGGKTGCDFDSYKNMIGAFYPARALHVFSSFIENLPQKEYISGLAEAIKTAFLFSPEMTKLFKEKKEEVLKRDPVIVNRLISECAKAKASVVYEDFKEKGRRAFLNLGHTFGHALESVAGLGSVTHGEGVAWGSARAADLAFNLGLCTKEYADECKSILASYGYDTKSIPSCLSADKTEELLKAMHKDKKNNSSSVRVIIQKDFQDTLIKEVSDSDILKVLKA